MTALGTTAVGRWKRYPEYKPTGVEWLGNVPSHWTALKIKRLCQVKRGSSPRPIEDPTYFDEAGEYAWVRISDVTASEKYLFSTEERLSEMGKSKSVALEPGRLFLSIAASVGKPIITKIKCCIHDGFVYFVDLKQDSEYWYYVFKSGQLFSGLGKLGTQLNLNTDTIGDIWIPRPPFPEQRAIAAFLDRETARIDALIGYKERLIALLEEKRQAVISHAVTRGLDPNAPLKDSGLEWIGFVPGHWSVKQLRHLVKPSTSITYGIVQAGPDVPDGVPYIRTSDMSGDELPREGYLRTSLEIDQSYSRSRVHQGDIVIGIRASVGKALPVPKYLSGANLTQGTAKIAPGVAITGEYLLFVLQSSGSQQRFQALAKGATFREITLDMLRRFSVPCPPITEQNQITRYLRRLSQGYSALVGRIRDGIARLQEYRTALISAAVSGQIDVRDEVTS